MAPLEASKLLLILLLDGLVSFDQPAVRRERKSQGTIVSFWVDREGGQCACEARKANLLIKRHRKWRASASLQGSSAATPRDPVSPALACVHSCVS